MRRALARPAVHFLVLGALLVGVDRVVVRDEPEVGESERPTIEIDRARVDALRAGWLARTGESPGAAALCALVEAEVDDEILLHEARARGLQARDPVVRARLARNVAFIRGDDEGRVRAGDVRSFEEALELGLADADLVVRRRLIERMRADLASRAIAEPGADGVEARFAREAGRFAGATRVRLSHAFVSRDRRGAELASDARRLRAALADEGLTLDEAIPRGDGFLLGHTLAPRTRAELERDFGAAFARAVFALEPGRVSQPIESSYGLHVVLVHERGAGAPAALETVRARIEAELVRERETAALRRALDALRARYEIRVEGRRR